MKKRFKEGLKLVRVLEESGQRYNFSISDNGEMCVMFYDGLGLEYNAYTYGILGSSNNSATSKYFKEEQFEEFWLAVNRRITRGEVWVLRERAVR